MSPGLGYCIYGSHNLRQPILKSYVRILDLIFSFFLLNGTDQVTQLDTIPSINGRFMQYLCCIKYPSQVGIDHSLPLFRLHPHEQGVSCDPSVIDQDINSLPFCNCLIKQSTYQAKFMIVGITALLLPNSMTVPEAHNLDRCVDWTV